LRTSASDHAACAQGAYCISKSDMFKSLAFRIHEIVGYQDSNSTTDENGDNYGWLTIGSISAVSQGINVEGDRLKNELYNEISLKTLFR
jgi:hypothetical protein